MDCGSRRERERWRGTESSPPASRAFPPRSGCGGGAGGAGAALPRLHAITDERIARRGDLDEVARRLAMGGGSQLAFHARGHALSGLEHYALSTRLSVYPPTAVFVNDRVDVALAAG